MSAVAPVEATIARIGSAEHALVRMMRFWVAQPLRDQLLPGLVALAERVGADSHTAVAVDSMLSLTEACLERPLIAEDDHSLRLGFDELAVLALIDQGRFIDGARSPRSIPHGLPGVLAWATVAVRRAFTHAGLELGDSEPTTGICPFSAAGAFSTI